jgi:hypothetical protein
MNVTAFGLTRLKIRRFKQAGCENLNISQSGNVRLLLLNFSLL